MEFIFYDFFDDLLLVLPYTIAACIVDYATNYNKHDLVFLPLSVQIH